MTFKLKPLKLNKNTEINLATVVFVKFNIETFFYLFKCRIPVNKISHLIQSNFLRTNDALLSDRHCILLKDKSCCSSL